MDSFPTAEEITRDWGERCPDYDSECSCCQMWGMHDEILRLRAEVERLTQIAEDRLADNARLTNEKTDALLSAAYSRAEAFERAAQIAEKMAAEAKVAQYTGTEEDYPFAAGAETALKEVAAAIRQAGKDGGAG